MKTAANIVNNVKASYTVVVMGVLGVFALISAVLIAWPALAYLGAKMFN
jgi:phage-related minor tail protein